MSAVATDVRAFLLARFAGPLQAKGLTVADVPDDFDLHFEGVVDSLGVLEMITDVEQHFGLEIDFEELDADDITVVGPFVRYVEAKSMNSTTSYP